MGQPRNIFVAYELLRPERGDDRISQTIEAFGCAWARINKTVFYIHGDLDAQYVGNKVWAAMNMDDKLVVIDATKNDARWYNIKPEISEFLVANWHV
ncbi:MAG: hypothetical protein AB7E79_05000 [Rhodospirillaceae bacterium]